MGAELPKKEPKKNKLSLPDKSVKTGAMTQQRASGAE